MNVGWLIRSFRSYANFRGRASRSEFWIFCGCLLFVLVLIVGAAAWGGLPLRVVLPVVVAVCAFPYWSVAVRRLHDTGRSGWWMTGYLALWFAAGGFSCFPEEVDASVWLFRSRILILAILFVYLAFMFYWWCLPGEPKANKYGRPTTPTDTEQ